LQLSEIANEILPRLKAAWYRQPIDEPTVRLWFETLANQELMDVLPAIQEFILSDRAEPPTPGMVYQAALARRQYRREEQRRQTRALPEPARTPEEIARARKIFAPFTNPIRALNARCA